MPSTPPRTAALRAAGTCLVVELSEPVPRVLHWGADPHAGPGADPHADAGSDPGSDARAFDRFCAGLAATADPPVLRSSLDVPRTLTVWPTEAEGWHGTPGHQGHLAGARSAPRLATGGVEVRHDPGGGGEIDVRMADDAAGLDARLTYTLDPSGVLAVAASLTRRATPDPGTEIGTGPGADAGLPPYDLAHVTTLLPLPHRAAEILDFTGKWSRERSPQRTALHHGTYAREVRRGKPGLDSPYLLAVGEPGFGFRGGEVWAVHVAWSGDQRYVVDRLPEGAGVHGAVLGGGELLRPGEIRLAPGETYHAPVCHFAWSGDGLDGLAARFHTLLRARPGHPRTPRPLILNSWEAVYFDHDLDRLLRLADRAAQVGVERFVLDDGWFTGRRSDRAGLGDWDVDPQVWPDGLTPLVAHVRGLGMQFGLWVEPEMVNPDSALAREHPDWVLGPARGKGPTARHQYVLDLANPDAWAYLLDRIDGLVAAYDVDYLKWDHNRELHEAVHGPGDRPVAHAQVAALYRLVDALRQRHPGLEIESCASGGGRIDLGILARTDRVWASDCNDPVERQTIQRWTGQLLPPELVGAHIGDATSHTTGRVTAGAFRLATALFGHAGIEQDLTRCTADELALITAWSALYRELRPLLHTGTVVRADLPDDAVLLHGVVARDGERALYCWARLGTSADAQSGRVRLPGLDAHAAYDLRVRTELGLPSLHQVGGPAWLTAALGGRVPLPGAVLAAAGVPMPTLDPGQALLLDVRRVDGPA